MNDRTPDSLIHPDLTLSAEDAAGYRGLLRAAMERADAYRGGESQLDSLYDPLMQAEAMIAARVGAKVTPDIERHFAAVAGVDDSSSFNDILGRASRAFKHHAAESSHDLQSMLDFLQAGGAKIVHAEGLDFMPTGQGRLQAAKRANPVPFRRVFQPRLIWLATALKEIGIYADDLIVHVRKVDPHKLRATPFMVVEIPRHQKQIVLANQRGEITFVADARYDLATWETLEKYMLKTLPGVTPVVFRDRDRWTSRVLGLIQSEGVAIGPKVDLDRDLKAPKRVRMPYSVAMIVESLKATHAATGEWASEDTGIIAHGPLANGLRTWISVHLSMFAIWSDKRGFASMNGLTKENCPFNGLATLKGHYELNNHYCVDDIVASLRSTYSATGKWATANSGLIMHGPLAKSERTWASIDATMRQIWSDKKNKSTINGLTRTNCPFNNLSALKDYYGMSSDYTVADIVSSLRATYAATGKWVTERRGIIEHGPLANGVRTWVSVNAAMTQIWSDKKNISTMNGLTRENCPYASLGLLKAAYGMKGRAPEPGGP